MKLQCALDTNVIRGFGTSPYHTCSKRLSVALSKTEPNSSGEHAAQDVMSEQTRGASVMRRTSSLEAELLSWNRCEISKAVNMGKLQFEL